MLHGFLCSGNKERITLIDAEQSLEINIGLIHCVYRIRNRIYDIKEIAVMLSSICDIYEYGDATSKIYNRVHLYGSFCVLAQRP